MPATTPTEPPAETRTEIPSRDNTETPGNAFAITQVAAADGPALAATNIPAFWADPHWRLSWRHRTLDYHISQVALRYPRNLLRNRATARHQKAVDTVTGEILGYARWSIPASAGNPSEKEDNGGLTWPEALIPAVSAEEEAEISRMADTAVWDPDDASDSLMDGAREIKNEILARKTYMSTVPSSLWYLALPPTTMTVGMRQVVSGITLTLFND